jgi:hypothetical protein
MLAGLFSSLSDKLELIFQHLSSSQTWMMLFAPFYRDPYCPDVAGASMIVGCQHELCRMSLT